MTHPATSHMYVYTHIQKKTCTINSLVLQHQRPMHWVLEKDFRKRRGYKEEEIPRGLFMFTQHHINLFLCACTALYTVAQVLQLTVYILATSLDFSLSSDKSKTFGELAKKSHQYFEGIQSAGGHLLECPNSISFPMHFLKSQSLNYGMRQLNQPSFTCIHKYGINQELYVAE